MLHHKSILILQTDKVRMKKLSVDIYQTRNTKSKPFGSFNWIRYRNSPNWLDLAMILISHIPPLYFKSLYIHIKFTLPNTSKSISNWIIWRIRRWFCLFTCRKIYLKWRKEILEKILFALSHNHLPTLQIARKWYHFCVKKLSW